MNSKLTVYDLLNVAETLFPDSSLEKGKSTFDETMKDTLMSALSKNDEKFIANLADLTVCAVNIMRYSLQGGILAGAVISKIITTHTDDDARASAEIMQNVEDVLYKRVHEDEIDEDDEDDEEEFDLETVGHNAKVKVIKASSLEDALDQIRKDIEEDIKKEKGKTKKASKKDK